MNSSLTTQEYKEWINELKDKFQSSQIKASLAVNSALLEFYWNLGGEIVQKQKDFSWGSGFLQQLSADLSSEFPDVKGFSYRNIRAIKQWYIFWQQVVAKTENEEAKQLVSQLVQIPWGHNIVIIQKCKEIEAELRGIE